MLCRMKYIFIPALLVSKCYVCLILGVQVDAASLSTETKGLTIEKGEDADSEASLSILFKSSEDSNTFNNIDETKLQKNSKGQGYRSKQKHVKNIKYKEIEYWKPSDSSMETTKQFKASPNVTNFTKNSKSLKFPGKKSQILQELMDIIKIAGINNSHADFLNTSFLNFNVKIDDKGSEKLTRDLFAAKKISERKQKIMKSQKPTPENFVEQNRQGFVLASQQKPNYSNVSEKNLKNIAKKSHVRHNTHGHHRKKQIKTKFQDKSSLTLRKKTTLGMFSMRAYQNFSKTSELIPNIKNNLKIISPRDATTITSNFSKQKTDDKGNDKREKLIKDHYKTDDIPDRKFKGKKSRKQKPNYSNESEKNLKNIEKKSHVSHNTHGHHRKKQIKTKFHDKSSLKLRKKTKLGMFSMRAYQNFSKTSELIPNIKNNLKIISPREATTITSNSSKQKTDDKGTDKREKLIKDHYKTDDIPDRKFKGKKSRKLMTKYFIQQNPHFQVLFTVSEQKPNYFNVSKTVVNITSDLIDLPNISLRKFQDSSTKTFAKMTEQSMNEVRDFQYLSKTSKLIPNPQSTTSEMLIPKFPAIDSRLKYITVELNENEFINKFTAPTKVFNLKVFSGPYIVSTSTTPHSAITPPEIGHETVSFENDNKIFLINKKREEPVIKELTYNLDMKQMNGIDDILKEVKLDYKEMDQIFETEIRRLKSIPNKILSGDVERKKIMFSDLKETTNKTSILNNNFYLNKRFNNISGEKVGGKKIHNNVNGVLTTVKHNPHQLDVSKPRVVKNGVRLRDAMKTSEIATEETAKWKRLHYSSSYSDEEGLIKKNLERALDVVETQDEKDNI